jgi:hypothetical protein
VALDLHLCERSLQSGAIATAVDAGNAMYRMKRAPDQWLAPSSGDANGD